MTDDYVEIKFLIEWIEVIVMEVTFTVEFFFFIWLVSMSVYEYTPRIHPQY